VILAERMINHAIPDRISALNARCRSLSTSPRLFLLFERSCAHVVGATPQQQFERLREQVRNRQCDARMTPASDRGTSFRVRDDLVPEFWGNAPHPTLTGIGVTWLYGFQFEIKVIAKLPETTRG
jgi:hypothetical protein